MKRFWTLALVVLALTSAGGEVDAESGKEVFEFDRYNDTYTGLNSEFSPIQLGPISIKLSSEQYEITVRSNRLELEKNGRDTHRALVSARIEGAGDLSGQVMVGVVPTQVEDRVMLPAQDRAVEATIRLEPDPLGYLVTLEEIPRTLEVEIESELAGRLVSICSMMSAFLAGDAACEQLGKLLSHPDLPLPEPGTQFVVRRDLLTRAERARIDGYLGLEPSS